MKSFIAVIILALVAIASSASSGSLRVKRDAGKAEGEERQLAAAAGSAQGNRLAGKVTMDSNGVKFEPSSSTTTDIELVSAQTL